MDFSSINFLAVLVATLSTFLVGALWYGPFFGKAWMDAVGFTEEDIEEERGSMVKIFGLAFIFELIMAFNLAMFLTGSPEAAESMTAGAGAFYGFLAGFGWVFFTIAVNSLFEDKPWKYVFINGGYWTITFTLMGLILGAWT